MGGMHMRFPEKSNPAASELLGSMDADGAKHLNRQSNDDQEDMSITRLVQPFSAGWNGQHFGFSPHRVACAATLIRLTWSNEVAPTTLVSPPRRWRQPRLGLDAMALYLRWPE